MLVAILSAKDTEQRIFNHRSVPHLLLWLTRGGGCAGKSHHCSHWDSLLCCTVWRIRIRDRRRKWNVGSKVEHSGNLAAESGECVLFEQTTRTKAKYMNVCIYSSYFHDENLSLSCVCNSHFYFLFKIFFCWDYQYCQGLFAICVARKVWSMNQKQDR